MKHSYIIPLEPLPTSNMMMPIQIPVKDGMGRPTGKKRTALVYDNEAQKYLASVKAHLELQRLKNNTPTLRCQCSVMLVVYRRRDAGDVDNYHKGVLDQTQKAGLIENDRLYKDLRVVVKTDPSFPRIQLFIKQLPHDGDLFADAEQNQ